MTLDQIMPILRHGLQIFAGILVHRGVVSEGVALEIVGLGVSLATFAWYRWSKSRKALKEAAK